MPESSRGVNQRRLLEIIRALIDGERLDRYEVARRYKVQPQTAHRQLTTIREVLPIVVEKDGRRNVYTFNRKEFEETPSVAEALAASFGAGFAKMFRGTTYERQLREIRERIVRRLGSARQEQFRHIGRKLMVLSHQETLLDDRQGILDDVLEGLLKQKVLKVSYEHFEGDREELDLTPYSLVVSSGWLYVVSPNAQGKLHPFRFARLLSAEVTATTFDYPSGGEYDPEALFRDSFGVFLNLPVQDVRLLVDDRWRSFLRTHRWHPSQVMRPLASGGVEVCFRVRVCRELKAWILSLGPEVEVLEPEELRIWIAERAKETVTRYAARV